MGTPVKTDSDTDNWRNKYFDSLASLENEQRRFAAVEAALKRLTGRLCTASLGQSPRLDEQLKRLQNAIRRNASSEELDKITPALTDAIQALDELSTTTAAGKSTLATPAPAARAANPAPTALDDARVRAILTALLAELKRDPDLAPQAEAVDARLATALPVEQVPDVLAALTDMVGLRIKRIESAKQEIEVLLSHMVGKLDEIGQFVADQNRSQNESHASSETLNVQLVGEMKAIGDSVESASDLQQIRAQVRTRIDSIDRHLQEFRQREAALATQMSARNEQMRSRIAELESESNHLQKQLQAEQRLSTRDSLTKIPNRLAYEKRMDEEVKRWQRFQQPACVAVWDVDHFKQVNDRYGHRAGDRVLQVVAECLSTRIRGTDFVARYGGEEFVMILPDTKLEDALHVADALRNAIASIGFHFRGAPVSITISSGLTALLPDDSAGSAFDRADKALYRAKEAGRNRCVSG